LASRSSRSASALAPARNRHNLANTPGGSSSGSAAAVAAGAVPVALGTQTVGSVNRPAAYCGVAAFKPSTQSTCTHGITALAPVFDTVGFYGTKVADAVALYDAVAPAFTASFDRVSGSRYRIVRLEDATLDSCDGEILKRVGYAARSITGGGHAARAAASPEDLAMMFETQGRVVHYEASRIYRALLDLPEDRVGPKFRQMIGKGLALSEETYRDDRTRLAAARATFWVAFPEIDAILFPAAPQIAPAGLASTGDPRYIGPWTALGGAIVTQPMGHHTNRLPIGMLVCGRPGSDRGAALLIAVSRALARIHVEHDDPWRSPPLVHSIDPPGRQSGKSGEVLRLRQPCGLEPAHLAGRGGRCLDGSVADHPAHRRIAA